ncbi:hypothetical protein ABPG74_018005 [Tetrahymena malaccensis]
MDAQIKIKVSFQYYDSFMLLGIFLKPLQSCSKCLQLRKQVDSQRLKVYLDDFIKYEMKNDRHYKNGQKLQNKILKIQLRVGDSFYLIYT